jgi:hypothetical protein
LILESYRSRNRNSGKGPNASTSTSTKGKSKGKGCKGRGGDDDEDDLGDDDYGASSVPGDEDLSGCVSSLADEELEAMAKLIERNCRPATRSNNSNSNSGSSANSNRSAVLQSLLSRRSSSLQTQPQLPVSNSGSVFDSYTVDPELSGKLLVLFRLMQVRATSDLHLLATTTHG